MALVKTVELKILADAADAQRQIDEVAAKGDKLQANTIRMRFKLDSAEGKAQLDAIKAKADEMGFKDVSIRVRVDGKGRAVADLEAVRREAEAAGRGGLLSRIGGLIGGAGAGIPGSAGPLPLPALAAAVPLAGALAVEITGVASGFAAAGAGAGAFALLAVPAVRKVEQALKDTPKKLAGLWPKMSPDEQGAFRGIRSLEAEFGKLSLAFQPAAFRVFNDGLKVMNNLLPHITQFATPFAGALDGLLQKLGKFTASKGFSDWLKTFSKDVGPATTAIGEGIGKVANATGKLLTLLSHKDVAHSISLMFSGISGTISVVTSGIHTFMQNWDSMSRTATRDAHEVASAFDSIRHGAASMGHGVAHDFDTVRHAIASLPGTIVHALGNLGGLLVQAGRNLVGGLIRGIESGLPSLLGELGKVAAFIAEHKGPPEKDRLLLVPAGRAVMQGLISGIESERPALGHQLAGITRDISGTTGYGGGGVHYHITNNFNGVVGDKYAVAQEIHQTLRDFKRNRGGAALGLS